MAATKLDKGKGREVVPVDDSVWLPATQNDKKRQSPKSSGQKRNPGCKRCVRIGKECYNQVGFASACVTCAKVKMRCEVLDAEEKGKEVRIVEPPPPTTPAPSMSDIPATTPAPSQSVVPAKRSAPESNPRPSKKRSKKKTAPAPAPAPSGSRKKNKLETPEIVAADADQFSDEGNWPAHRRSFADFETYYGKVFFSSNLIYICQYFVRYLHVEARGTSKRDTGNYQCLFRHVDRAR